MSWLIYGLPVVAYVLGAWSWPWIVRGWFNVEPWLAGDTDAADSESRDRGR